MRSAPCMAWVRMRFEGGMREVLVATSRRCPPSSDAYSRAVLVEWLLQYRLRWFCCVAVKRAVLALREVPRRVAEGSAEVDDGANQSPMRTRVRIMNAIFIMMLCCCAVCEEALVMQLVGVVWASNVLS